MEKDLQVGLLNSAPAEKKLEQKKDNPSLGALFFVLSGVFMTLNFIFGKLIYESSPQTTPFQLLVYRSIISCAIMIITVNRNLKKVMWDEISRN